MDAYAFLHAQFLRHVPVNPPDKMATGECKLTGYQGQVYFRKGNNGSPDMWVRPEIWPFFKDIMDRNLAEKPGNLFPSSMDECGRMILVTEAGTETTFKFPVPNATYVTDRRGWLLNMLHHPPVGPAVLLGSAKKTDDMIRSICFTAGDIITVSGKLFNDVWGDKNKPPFPSPRVIRCAMIRELIAVGADWRVLAKALKLDIDHDQEEYKELVAANPFMKELAQSGTLFRLTTEDLASLRYFSAPSVAAAKTGDAA